MTEMNKAQRRLKYGISSAVGILIVAGILIALNVISSRLFVRADLTEQREFTVSPATRQILRELDDVVSIKVFFTRKLPPQLATLRQQIEDLLKEYRVYSGGKVQVRIYDPNVEPERAQEAQSMGIAQVQMNLLEKDQFQVTNVFMGLGVQFGDKVETIPFIQDASTLEYDLTSALLKVTRDEQKTLGFLSGNQERTLDRDLEGIRTELARQYEVRPVDLAAGRTAVSEEINTLIVAGSRSVPERIRYEIDQYIMRGGRVLFLLDSVTMNEQAGLSAIGSASGFEDLLASYGVGIKNSLVLDARNSTASFSQGFMAFMVPYPFWPKVVRPDLDAQNPITSRLESLTLPWAAPLDVRVAVAQPSGSPREPAQPSPQPEVVASILARTSDRAWIQSGRYDLNPQSLMMTRPQVTGEQFPLAVALTGKFRSHYADKTPPPKPGDEGAAVGETPLQESPLTQVIVVGNSQFMTNMFLRNFPENALFLQNAVDWMTLGNELISIRSRGATARPVRELSDGARTGVKILLTAGVPILVILAGLLRTAVRRRRRQLLADEFRPAS